MQTSSLREDDVTMTSFSSPRKNDVIVISSSLREEVTFGTPLKLASHLAGFEGEFNYRRLNIFSLIMSIASFFFFSTATAANQNTRCQKCLEMGHWTYECKGQRKYVHRDSRTQKLKRTVQEAQKKSAVGYAV